MSQERLQAIQRESCENEMPTVRGASGFWVERGQITRPVNECTIAGNLRDMLLRIIPANDGREERSHVVPSILISDMVIAGQ